MSRNKKESESRKVAAGKAASEQATQTKKKSVSQPTGGLSERFSSYIVTLIIAIFGMTFIVQATNIPTGSMENTVLVGDYLLVNKFIFAPGEKSLPFLPQREIRRGDVVVFKYPGNRLHPEYDSRHDPPSIPYQSVYVKRVIGMPGDEVEFRNDQVYVNGQLLPEHRVIGDAPNENSALKTKEFEPRASSQPYDVYYSEETIDAIKKGVNLDHDIFDFGVAGKPMKVPENQYFMMGDNRDNSEDSRVWGFVDRNLIIGEAMFVYWSCDKGTNDESAFSCLMHPRLNRIGQIIR